MTDVVRKLSTVQLEDLKNCKDIIGIKQVRKGYGWETIYILRLTAYLLRVLLFQGFFQNKKVGQ